MLYIKVCWSWQEVSRGRTLKVKECYKEFETNRETDVDHDGYIIN